MAQSATKSNNHNAVTSTRRSVRFSGKPKVDYYAEKVWSLVEDESKRRNVAVSAPASQNSNNAQSVQDNHAQQSVQRRRTHARQSNGQQQSSSEMMHKIVHQMDALREQIRVEERQRLFCGIFKQYLLDLGHKFYGTLSDNGKDHPLRVTKPKKSTSKSCTNMAYGICNQYLKSSGAPVVAPSRIIKISTGKH
eukprot:212560_1